MIRVEFWDLADSDDPADDGFGRYVWGGFIEAEGQELRHGGWLAERILDPAQGIPELSYMEPMTVVALDADPPRSLSHTEDPERWARFLPYHFRTAYTVCEIVHDDTPWSEPAFEDDQPIEVALDRDARIAALTRAQDDAILDGRADASEQELVLGRVVKVKSTSEMLAEAKEYRRRELAGEGS